MSGYNLTHAPALEAQLNEHRIWLEKGWTGDGPSDDPRNHDWYAWRKDRSGLDECIATGEVRDIRMRMLSVDELRRAQGFPDDYRLPAKSTLAKKFIGNSVPPPLASALADAQHPGLTLRAAA